jgi:hypothetical protein
MRLKSAKLTSLPLEGIDDIQRGDRLSLGMLGVGDCITDDTLQEGLQNTAGLFVDHSGDTLDTTTAGETADRRLRDALDVVTQNLAMALGTTLSKTLATFATYNRNTSTTDDTTDYRAPVLGWRILTASHFDRW